MAQQRLVRKIGGMNALTTTTRPSIRNKEVHNPVTRMFHFCIKKEWKKASNANVRPLLRKKCIIQQQEAARQHLDNIRDITCIKFYSFEIFILQLEKKYYQKKVV